MTDFARIRADFPALAREIRGKPLAYLDNAATSQKPRAVLEAMRELYERSNANVHRGAHTLSQEATDSYEGVREKVRRFIDAPSGPGILFTSGATESINLAAASWARARVGAGDSVVVTRLEHHANFVPWQQLALEKGAQFRIVELTPELRLDLDQLRRALEGRPKLVAVSLMSNVLGALNPVAEIAALARKAGARVLVDAAQAAAHFPLRIPELGPIDFLAFSAHKLCGPTGTGVLWASNEALSEMSPYQFGGDMILSVRDDHTEWNEPPWKFEAGTPNIAGVVGMGAALDYLAGIGMKEIAEREHALAVAAFEKLGRVRGLRIVGPPMGPDRASVVAFGLEGVHPHDLATFLDSEAIAVRAGHHCAQPLHRKLGLAATARASFSFYNTEEEVARLASALERAREYFRRGA